MATSVEICVLMPNMTDTPTPQNFQAARKYSKMITGMGAPQPVRFIGEVDRFLP